MVICVWGFPSKVASLQFEFAWQHPSVCRHVKEKVAHLGFCKLTRHGRQRAVQGVSQNIQVLLQMLQASPYCGMPLRVHVLDQATWDALQKLPSLRGLPKHLPVTFGNFDDLEQLCAEAMTTMVMPVSGAVCITCRKALQANDRVLSCPGCGKPFHVSCAAQVFLGKESSRLMPEGPSACPSCEATTEWPVLIRSARRLSHAPIVPQVTKDGSLQDEAEGDDDEDEDEDEESENEEEEDEDQEDEEDREEETVVLCDSDEEVGGVACYRAPTATPPSNKRRKQRRNSNSASKENCLPGASLANIHSPAPISTGELKADASDTNQSSPTLSLRERLLRRRVGDESVMHI